MFSCLLGCIHFVKSRVEGKRFDIHTIEGKFFDSHENNTCSTDKNNFSSNFYTFNRKKSFVILRKIIELKKLLLEANTQE